MVAWEVNWGVVVCRDPIWDGRVKMTCRSNVERQKRIVREGDPEEKEEEGED